jgi:hypothetical protein
MDNDWLPTWLRPLGYKTYFTGKFINLFDVVRALRAGGGGKLSACSSSRGAAAWGSQLAQPAVARLHVWYDERWQARARAGGGAVALRVSHPQTLPSPCSPSPCPSLKFTPMQQPGDTANCPKGWVSRHRAGPHGALPAWRERAPRATSQGLTQHPCTRNAGHL